MQKNSNKIFYIARISSAIILFALTLSIIAGFTPSLYKILELQLGTQLTTLLAGFSVVTFTIILSMFLLTFIFGRFYCSIACPFGLLQDFIGFICKRKTGKTQNLYKTRYFITSVVFGLLISGSIIGLKILDPYTNFSLIISNFLKTNPGISMIHAILALIVILAFVIFKNRIFCTTICPIGTLLGLCSKYGVFKLQINSDNCAKCNICEKECPTGCIDSGVIDNERCTRCLRCLDKCSKNAIKFKNTTFTKKDNAICEEKRINTTDNFNPSRRKFILGCAFLGVALASAKAGLFFAKKSLSNLKKNPICPPGAESYEKFASKCTSCNLCVTNCKGNVLKSADSEHDTVHLDYNSGKCEHDCHRCSEICPNGALKKISLEEKQHCKIGEAKINPTICMKCGACVNECPTGAVTRRDGDFTNAPVINPKLCIGCGACEHVCSVKAITVGALDKQTFIDI